MSVHLGWVVGLSGARRLALETAGREGRLCVLLSISSLVLSVPEVTNLGITVSCCPSSCFTREHIVSPPLHV